jgi:hypothetical protein
MIALYGDEDKMNVYSGKVKNGCEYKNGYAVVPRLLVAGDAGSITTRSNCLHCRGIQDATTRVNSSTRGINLTKMEPILAINEQSTSHMPKSEQLISAYSLYRST